MAHINKHQLDAELRSQFNFEFTPIYEGGVLTAVASALPYEDGAVMPAGSDSSIYVRFKSTPYFVLTADIWVYFSFFTSGSSTNDMEFEVHYQVFPEGDPPATALGPIAATVTPDGTNHLQTTITAINNSVIAWRIPAPIKKNSFARFEIVRKGSTDTNPDDLRVIDVNYATIPSYLTLARWDDGLPQSIISIPTGTNILNNRGELLSNDGLTDYTVPPPGASGDHALTFTNSGSTGMEWTPVSVLTNSLYAPYIQNLTPETATFTAAFGETHLVDTSGGDFTANLPAIASGQGRISFYFTGTGGQLTLDPNASETIEGKTTVKLALGHSTIENDGVGWKIIQRSGKNPTRLDPVQITADQNDYSPTDWGQEVTHMYLDSDASRTLTGVEENGFTDMAQVIVVNDGSNDIIIAHDSASSAVNNRVLVDGGSDFTLSSNKVGVLLRDGAVGKWRLYSITSGGGGGAPTGPAGGDLSGTYPNPTVNDGADGTAIHNNVLGEIASIVTKPNPGSADLLLIEDSAGANTKRKITIGSLPVAGLPDVLATDSSTGANDISILSGQKLTSSAEILIEPPSPTTGSAHPVTVKGGSHGTINPGAECLIEGGDGGSTTGNGGPATLRGGDGPSLTGNGGDARVLGGNASGFAGTSGGANVDAGTAASTVFGSVNISTTNAVTTNISTAGKAQTLNLNTGASTKTTNIGSTTGTSSTAINSGATGDITFDARGATSPIPFNDFSNADLGSGFAATSVVGALNELRASVKSVGVLGTSGTIDLFAATGTTTIYTVTLGKQCVVTGVILRVTTAPGSITTTPSGGIQISGGSNDIVVDTTLTALGATVNQDIFYMTPAGGVLRKGDSTEIIEFSLNTQGVGTGTFEVVADLIGYEF